MVMIIIQTLRCRLLHRSSVIAPAMLKVDKGTRLIMAEATIGGAADEPLAGEAGAAQGLVVG